MKTAPRYHLEAYDEHRLGADFSNQLDVERRQQRHTLGDRTFKLKTMSTPTKAQIDKIFCEIALIDALLQLANGVPVSELEMRVTTQDAETIARAKLVQQTHFP